MNKADRAMAGSEYGWRPQIADKYFCEKYACSQAVLAAFGEELGMARELCFRVAAGFGGGMGGLAETCGALTGAFMVVGLLHGGEVGEKDKTYAMVRKVAREFKARNKGAMLCRDLLGFDLSTREGMRLARKNDLFRTRCRKFVRDCVEILEEIEAE